MYVFMYAWIQAYKLQCPLILTKQLQICDYTIFNPFALNNWFNKNSTDSSKR